MAFAFLPVFPARSLSTETSQHTSLPESSPFVYIVDSTQGTLWLLVGPRLVEVKHHEICRDARGIFSATGPE